MSTCPSASRLSLGVRFSAHGEQPGAERGVELGVDALHGVNARPAAVPAGGGGQLQAAWHEEAFRVVRATSRDLPQNIPPACWEGRRVGTTTELCEPYTMPIARTRTSWSAGRTRSTAR